MFQKEDCAKAIAVLSRAVNDDDLDLDFTERNLVREARDLFVSLASRKKKCYVDTIPRSAVESDRK